MGEIGFPRSDFLHELRWWEVKSIIRGYNNRHRHIWSATRWSTFHIMSSMVGSEGMHKAGIYKLTDLLEFPWETQPRAQITQEEIDSMQAEMAALNAASAQK